MEGNNGKRKNPFLSFFFLRSNMAPFFFFKKNLNHFFFETLFFAKPLNKTTNASSWMDGSWLWEACKDGRVQEVQKSFQKGKLTILETPFYIRVVKFFFSNEFFFYFFLIFNTFFCLISGRQY